MSGMLFADEAYNYSDMQDTWASQGAKFGSCYHIAVSGKHGRIMILKWDDFEPLASIPAKGVKEGICDLKFTPAGAPKPLLAAASHDQCIYIYSVHRGYQYAFLPCIYIQCIYIYSAHGGYQYAFLPCHAWKGEYSYEASHGGADGRGIMQAAGNLLWLLGHCGAHRLELCCCGRAIEHAWALHPAVQ
jgi:WD40 repeat protein